jgi:hypothetical protein
VPHDTTDLPELQTDASASHCIFSRASDSAVDVTDTGTVKKSPGWYADDRVILTAAGLAELER